MKQGSLAQMLSSIETREKKQSKGVLNKGLANERRIQALVEEIFEMMVTKGFISPVFTGSRGQIEKLQLIRKFLR